MGSQSIEGCQPSLSRNQKEPQESVGDNEPGGHAPEIGQHEDAVGSIERRVHRPPVVPPHPATVTSPLVIVVGGKAVDESDRTQHCKTSEDTLGALHIHHGRVHNNECDSHAHGEAKCQVSEHKPLAIRRGNGRRHETQMLVFYY